MNEATSLDSKGQGAEEKRENVAAFQWFHELDLGDGVITPGVKGRERLEYEAKRVFQHAIAGMSVLDVGCWDGYFSFEAQRRGASRVLATDYFVWGGPGWGSKGAFDLARASIEPAVEDLEIDVEALSVDKLGQFDVVLLLGVVNHLKNPLGAIERLSAMTRQMLVIETYVEEALSEDRPAMMLYPTNELNGDPTSWWGPNRHCINAILQTCGFAKIVEDTAYAQESPTRMLVHAFR